MQKEIMKDIDLYKSREMEIKMEDRIETSGPRCIKLLPVFYGKNSGNSGKKKISIAICIKICQSFSMAKKSLAKNLFQMIFYSW